MSALPTYQTVSVADRRTSSALNLFYREAGPKDAPAVLLLHGFPTSSHQYRGLIARLADKYHVIAPDLPGFGFSDAPDAKAFGYTFDHLAEVIEARNRPFIFATGYGTQGLPPEFRNRPALQKPFQIETLANMVEQALKGTTAA